MGAFELNSSTPRNDTRNDSRTEVHNAESLNPRRLREESIIALKVYDSCRQQDCLTESQLGPVRCAENVYDECHNLILEENDVVVPPEGSASVTVDFLKVKKIIIVDKKPNPFKNGFWDISLKYVFEYRLTFRRANGDIIRPRIRAISEYNKRITLFGSVGSDLAFSTDLLRTPEENTIDSEPFIMVEAKAVALSAELRQGCHHALSRRGENSDQEVVVTIGLFTIIKLFRIVTLNVESKGFSVPDECEDICPLNPCEFFDKLDFPLDIFAPPQKPEFMACVSGNIPRILESGVE